jgi:GTP cyclohydrolase I
MNQTAYELNGTEVEAHVIERFVRALIRRAGDDPNRPGVTETPARFLKAWDFYTSGYKHKPEEFFKTFADGAEGVDEMVVVGPLRVYSMCEHHLAPFFGKAWIGYIPNGKVLGLSKMPRLLRIFSRRLQVQERLTNQVADAMVQHLQPLGVGVVLQCRHLCMECRGVEEVGAVTTTSALRGNIKNLPDARAEFLAFAHNGK